MPIATAEDTPYFDAVSEVAAESGLDIVWINVADWILPNTEVLDPLLLGFPYIFVTLVDATVVAGVVGDGGLGDLSLRYGYACFDWVTVMVVVITLVLLMQFAQWIGDRIARTIRHQ